MLERRCVRCGRERSRLLAGGKGFTRLSMSSNGCLAACFPACLEVCLVTSWLTQPLSCSHFLMCLVHGPSTWAWCMSSNGKQHMRCAEGLIRSPCHTFPSLRPAASLLPKGILAYQVAGGRAGVDLLGTIPTNAPSFSPTICTCMVTRLYHAYACIPD